MNRGHERSRSLGRSRGLRSCPKHPDTEGLLPDNMRVFCTFRVCFLACRQVRPPRRRCRQPGFCGPACLTDLLARDLPARNRKDLRFPMDCPQGQDDKQDTTQDRTAGEKTAPNDTAGDDTGGDDTGREDTGQDESANPLAGLSFAERPAYEFRAIEEDLGDLERVTGEMAHRLRKGDSEGLAPLLGMTHLAVRGLRRELRDVRERIRNRFG